MGMPMCCKGNGGSGCTYKSNIECDTSNGDILEDAFKKQLTDINHNEDFIDGEDEDTIESYMEEGYLRE